MGEQAPEQLPLPDNSEQVAGWELDNTEVWMRQLITKEHPERLPIFESLVQKLRVPFIQHVAYLQYGKRLAHLDAGELSLLQEWIDKGLQEQMMTDAPLDPNYLERINLQFEGQLYDAEERGELTTEQVNEYLRQIG